MKRRPYNFVHDVWADVDEGYMIEEEIIWLVSFEGVPGRIAGRIEDRGPVNKVEEDEA